MAGRTLPQRQRLPADLVFTFSLVRHLAIGLPRPIVGHRKPTYVVYHAPAGSQRAETHPRHRVTASWHRIIILPGMGLRHNVLSRHRPGGEKDLTLIPRC